MYSHLLVIGQVAGLLAIMVPAGKPFAPNIPGVLLLLFGTGIGISALLANRPGNFGVYPQVRKGARLVTIGPYHWIRHPMYTAVLVCGLSLVLMHITLLSVCGYALLAAVLWAKAQLEEKHLTETFTQYAHYMQRTYRFIPFVV